jgi:NarL family two-component system response regulator LiaR
MIVDDHDMVRDSLKIFLLNYNDIEVVADISHGEQAVKLCSQLQPDVVLLDMVMPGMNEPTIVQALREVCPLTKVLILTAFRQENLVQQTLQEGAIDCLFKDDTPEQLVTAIRAAYAAILPDSP